MARPRKRKRPTSVDEFLTNAPVSKKQKVRNGNSQSSVSSRSQHPVLCQYYPHVQSLREYIITQLPPSSKIRRRKVSSIGIVTKPFDAPLSDAERSLGSLLDTTLVGHSNFTTEEVPHRMDEWKNFSQKGDESYVTLSNGVTGFVESQALILEHVVRTMFSREKSTKWPDHLLCDGFRRNGSMELRVVRPNHYVEALQRPPWPQLLALLGESGDRIMINLLLDCAIFVSVDTGFNNLCQISGRSLSSVNSYRPESAFEGTSRAKSTSELVFVRNRMFYARPALNARGQVHFGLRHIHVLNRCQIQKLDEKQDVETRTHITQQNEAHTLKVMMYMFPRQFGLHNVFTSKVNLKETSQRLKDYTLREEEIFAKFGRLGDTGARVKTPKRLRGHAKDLIRKLQVLHQRCSYSQLLQHYCPVHPSANDPANQSESDKFRRHTRKSKGKIRKVTRQSQKTIHLPQWHRNFPVTELATSSAAVSSFCQAVLKKVIPRGFWGGGLTASQNELQFLKKVDLFMSLRLYESIALHELTQGLKMIDIDWLTPPQLVGNKTSLTDIQKRREILNEFLYFLFDSILIPLVRSNFYVTESNTDKYRVFFFRHDVWRSLVEPAMIILKGKILEEVSLGEAKSILDARRLGLSHIRLLPKGGQMRPIANLRKRVPIRGSPKKLGPSINKILAPAHKILQLEKTVNSGKMGSAMFSVGDIYERVKHFKSGMPNLPARFYFAKLDVQSAFDTIPHTAMISLLDSIPQQRRYRISEYLEVSPSIATRGNSENYKSNPVKKWSSLAIKDNDHSTFIQRLENGQNTAKRDTVFVDLYQKQYETSEVLQLVASHIEQNLIKVGKKYYRQKQGIPQGSILSSTLCNYFYADLEAHFLPFLNSDDCLFLRLIDDFLLITTDKSKALRFVQILHQGVPEYGATVKPEKSLVNFDLVIDGQRVPKLVDGKPFPYCGTLIDTETLDIARASNHDQANTIFNSLTVEFSRTPGRTFQRKVLNAFKIQCHTMFFDTRLNSAPTILNNIYKAFVETATKMWAYARSLPAAKQPSSNIVIKTIQKLSETAYVLLTSRTRKSRYPDYECDIKKCEVSWLACNAFHQVLSRKQSSYTKTLAWLKARSTELSLLKDIRHSRVYAVV
ncbi:hypothetical protein GQX73_g4071 [Xylaria multiplex]|uniref:Telomerase reverse transcriptase n=1 Tax=Xylaria multiplex TaxID=323545 RepID=A0A7C8IWB4_9PEZI|nr:hypothetical protein GQX73_g4071 [Xylaria multiplex]